MSKRFLTDSEIDNILLFLKPQKGIPTVTAEYNIYKLKTKLRNELKNQFVNPRIIPNMKQFIEKSYFSSKISAGESVGIIASQSIGATTTQSTLNSFHFTGISERSMTNGMDRINELLTATENPKRKNCSLFFNKPIAELIDLYDVVNHTLQEIIFGQICDDYVITDVESDWYNLFEKHYFQTIPRKQKHLVFYIKQSMIFDYKLSLEQISQSITQNYSDLICIFSPDSICEIHVYPSDTSDISVDDTVLFIDKTNSVDIYLREIVLKNLDCLEICGITGIKNLFIEKDKNGTWKINTDGTNLKEILSLPYIDETKTHSNFIWEIYYTFGIEAVRKYMIDDFSQVVGDVNKSHIQLIIDKMTFKGTIINISRYSIRKDDIDVFTNATYEESMDKFINAGIFTQTDSTNGVSASIMCGNLGRFGTGSFSLEIDQSKLVSNEDTYTLDF